MKDVASDMVQGDTSIRENSNRFAMDDLSLFVFKSQAVLVSPGEKFKNCGSIADPHTAGLIGKKGTFTKRKN